MGHVARNKWPRVAIALCFFAALRFDPPILAFAAAFGYFVTSLASANRLGNQFPQVVQKALSTLNTELVGGREVRNASADASRSLRTRRNSRDESNPISLRVCAVRDSG